MIPSLRFDRVLTLVCLAALLGLSASCDDGSSGAEAEVDSDTSVDQGEVQSDIGDDEGGPELDLDAAELSQFGNLSGQIGLEDGGSPAGATVTLEESVGSTVTVLDDGVYSFLDIAAGSYRVTVNLEGYQEQSQEVTIVGGESTTLNFLLLPQGENTPPIIDSLEVDPQNLGILGQAVVSVVAHDPDGDPLSYEYAVDNGFSIEQNATPNTATLTAPNAAEQTGTVTVTVRDPSGATASATETVSTSSNRAPVISIFDADSPIEPNETVLVRVDVTDPEGQSLSLEYELSNSNWLFDEATLELTAPNILQDELTITLTATDSEGASTLSELVLSTTSCPTGLLDCDSDASNGCEPANSGSAERCSAANSCAEIKYALPESEDGIYWITIDSTSQEVYCDMSTDGGGWTLLATIAGGDENNWNTLHGLWADGNLIGDPSQPWLDYKSAAWNSMPVDEAEILFQRRFDGEVRAQSVLGNECLRGVNNMTQLFTSFDVNLACEPEHIRNLFTSVNGLNSTNYLEGSLDGLGGENTNGFCWNGGDNAPPTLAIRGHLFWTDDPSAPTCEQATHAGGIAVFSSATSAIPTDDISTTSWLAGTDTSLTEISLFSRTPLRMLGDLSSANPGMWPDGSIASSCEEYASGPLGPIAPDSLADGVYAIDRDGDGPLSQEHVYCLMSVDGGGWELLGTVAGSDENHWNVQVGLWADPSTLGSVDSPWLDYKSAAWSERDISDAEVLVQRRYLGEARGHYVLANTCLMDQSYFADIFADYDSTTTLACSPTDIRVVNSSIEGLNSADYLEGTGAYGFGSPTTNGMCWGGGDTNGNIFHGHFVYNQYPGATDCLQGGHLGGIAVFSNESSQYEDADITGTNWLNTTDFGATEVSFFVRAPDELPLWGEGTEVSPFHWSDYHLPESCTAILNVPMQYELPSEDAYYLIDANQDGDPETVYCELSSGGWTRVAYWNREEEGHSRSDFLSLMTEVFSNMTVFSNGASYLQWYDNDGTYDAMAYSVAIEVPNDGELRLKLHYTGNSMEASSVFFYAESAGEYHDLFCWQDTLDYAASYTATELSYEPYECAVGLDELTATWTWDEERSIDLTNAVDAFYISSLHADSNGGDSSWLYRFEVMVR